MFTHRKTTFFKVATAVGTMMLATPVWSAGFGFTAGPQIEERMGSEYGAEYYYRHSKEAQPQRRCRTVRVKTAQGHLVRRCR
jgi:hypothetical protein